MNSFKKSCQWFKENVWWWLKEHGKYRRMGYVVAWFLLSVGLLIGALTAPHVSNVEDTPLNQYLDFSGDSPASMRLTYKAYSPQKQRLVLRLNVKSSTADPTQQVIDNDLKFKVATANPTQAIVKVVPTTLNHFVVLIDHLAPKFSAIQVKVKNETPQTTTGGTIQKGGSLAFIINEKSSLIDSHLPQLTRRQYAQQAVEADLKLEQKRQVSQNQIIKKARAAIAADDEKITALNKDIKYQTTSQKSQTKEAVASLKQDQSGNQQTIKAAEKAIINSQGRVSLLQEKQQAIANGTYQLPAPTKTIRIK